MITKLNIGKFYENSLKSTKEYAIDLISFVVIEANCHLWIVYQRHIKDGPMDNSLNEMSVGIKPVFF
ncbi:MAG: hypothetical protein IPN14_12115 [Bacteroidetes bacterium]|nr:hypothetical protein [Bacteroidota bacterium]